MSIGISALAYALRVSSRTLPRPFSHGHALQLIAAALGHNSLASYQTSQEELRDLTGTKHVVVDIELLQSRLHDLGYVLDAQAIFPLLTESLQAVLPGVMTHHSASAFEDYLLMFIDDAISNDSDVVNNVTISNGTPDEFYLPFELAMDEIAIGEATEFELEGHVGLEQDLERPYNGHKVTFEASLFLERKGRVCLGQPEVTVTHARLRYYGDDDSNQDYDDEGPKISLAQAIAAQLGITEEDAQAFADADIQPNESNDDGLVYSYILDAETVELPAGLKAKLTQKFGGLRIELPASFYDDIHWSPYD